MKVLWQWSVKSSNVLLLDKTLVNICLDVPFAVCILKCYHLIISGHWVWLPLRNSMMTTPNNFLVYKMFENSFKIFFSFLFPRIKVKHLNPQFLRSCFLKSVVIFAFFQSSGTSSNHHDLPKMIIKSGLAVTASSLNTCGCIPSGSMDLCISSLFKCSLIWSSFTPSVSLHCSIFFHWIHGPRIPEGKFHQVKTEAIKALSTLASCKSFVTWSLCHSAADLHFL